jgi:hypothetical protein
MLHRDGPAGHITRPHATRGWFWQHELEASMRAGLIDRMEIDQWWTYTPCKCRSPLAEVKGLYDQRLKVGKNTPQGKSIRLVLNSLYGKLAQSAGEPKYSNWIYASLITARCRTMILDAIGTHPLRSDGVVMIATDAVYFREPHPYLHKSKMELGAWDETPKYNLALFKPGVYWDDTTLAEIQAGKAPRFKTRGINAKALAKHIGSINATFARWGAEYPSSEQFPAINVVSDFSMISPMQALQRNKWGICALVQNDKGTMQRSEPGSKRVPGWFDPSTGIYWSSPPKGKFKNGQPELSWGYDDGQSVAVTGRMPVELDYLTPDGTVMQGFSFALGLKG